MEQYNSLLVICNNLLQHGEEESVLISLSNACEKEIARIDKQLSENENLTKYSIDACYSNREDISEIVTNLQKLSNSITVSLSMYLSDFEREHLPVEHREYLTREQAIKLVDEMYFIIEQILSKKDKMKTISRDTGHLRNSIVLRLKILFNQLEKIKTVIENDVYCHLMTNFNPL